MVYRVALTIEQIHGSAKRIRKILGLGLVGCPLWAVLPRVYGGQRDALIKWELGRALRSRSSIHNSELFYSHEEIRNVWFSKTRQKWTVMNRPKPECRSHKQHPTQTENYLYQYTIR